jgi:hypothetical protein
MRQRFRLNASRKKGFSATVSARALKVASFNSLSGFDHHESRYRREPNNPDRHDCGQLRSDRRRLCERPCQAQQEHHWAGLPRALVEAFPDNKSVAALWEPASAEQLHIDLRSRGQDSQRGEAVRSSGRATNQFRIHIELENRQGTRCVDSDVDPAPRRRGDRIGSSLLRLLTAA